MPTVDRIDGLRVVIYPNDHRPAHVHVHVMGDGGEAVFLLHCNAGHPELRENYGFTAQRLATIALALALKSVHLCAAWRKWHGNV